jgi:hypothetical protein
MSKESSIGCGCLLLAYIEGVSAAALLLRSMVTLWTPGKSFRHRRGQSRGRVGTRLSRRRRLAIGGNDKAGARTALALVFASITLALCPLFPGLLENLPAVLAAVVLTAVYGLLDFPDCSTCCA